MLNKLNQLNKSKMQQASTLVILMLYTLMLSVISLKSQAATLNELIADNQLTIATTIKQNEQQIVGQPLVIVIEVATNRWFAKGTQVKEFDLANVVILANSEITINGTKRVNGQTWSTQTSEITIYPRRSGDYVLPAIKVKISVNTEKHGIIEGIITTKQQSFTVSLPKALANIEHYIVSPKVELELSTNIDSEQNYAVGEAINLTIKITTQSSPAMMIQPLIKPKLNGISIYQKTPQVFDKSNRGELVGTRIESFTFIFEKKGKYLIPEKIVYWWNTSTNALEKIIIPSLSFNVGKSEASANTTNRNNLVFNTKQFFWIILLISLTISFAFALYRYKKALLKLYANITHLEQRHAKKAFLRAISNHDYIVAINHLHKYSLLVNANLIQLKSAQALTLNKLAFDKNSQMVLFSKYDAKQLLKTLIESKKMKQAGLDVNSAIKLNDL